MDQKIFFDRQADCWDDNQALHRPHPDVILNLLRLRRGEDVLEIGCGSGWLLDAVSARIAPGRLFALDFSGKMLRKAAVRNIEMPIALLYAGAEDIPLPDRMVDRVLMVNTFSQFSEPRLVISEISRVLRKGGRLDIKYFFTREEVNSHHSSKPALCGLGIPDDNTLYEWLAAQGFVCTVNTRADGFHLAARLTRHVT